MLSYTSKDVQQALKTIAEGLQATAMMEVFGEYPSDHNVISEGYYVSRVFQAARKKNINGINPGGKVYNATDRIEFLLITNQVNDYVDAQLEVFLTLLDHPLFDEYNLREYTVEQQYVNNSERYKVTFDLSKLQIN